jgi:L-seryl-tRNA(Ser) seleniumtransferase
MDRRGLPSVDRLLRRPELAALPREGALAAAREALARAREEIEAGHDPGDIVERVLAAAAACAELSLRRVVNATGVVLHTNLGRAPLAEAALERVRAVGGYSNLEFDLRDGTRGSRHDHLAAVLRRLTGAEDALVVNNNAAALLLALSTLADGREVIVSRGELIEIGSGFRIPDVLTCSGVRLVEVGTTNRTRAADYESAFTPETALLLRVHQSNFRTVGFTERPALRELVALAHRHGVPMLGDLGSGSFVPLADEPLAPASIAAGADLVCFSGDKLLGGPQAGIICGSAELVGRLRRHPLQRALRPDKLTLAALEGTLRLFLDPERALVEVPVLRMLQEPLESVGARAEELARRTGGDVVETTARVGGGALPLLELPSVACALGGELAAPLRAAATPVVGLVREGRTLLDCRTIGSDELDLVVAAVESCR